MKPSGLSKLLPSDGWNQKNNTKINKVRLLEAKLPSSCCCCFQGKFAQIPFDKLVWPLPSICTNPFSSCSSGGRREPLWVDDYISSSGQQARHPTANCRHLQKIKTGQNHRRSGLCRRGRGYYCTARMKPEVLKGGTSLEYLN